MRDLQKEQQDSFWGISGDPFHKAIHSADVTWRYSHGFLKAHTPLSIISLLSCNMVLCLMPVHCRAGVKWVFVLSASHVWSLLSAISRLSALLLRLIYLCPPPWRSGASPMVRRTRRHTAHVNWQGEGSYSTSLCASVMIEAFFFLSGRSTMQVTR